MFDTLLLKEKNATKSSKISLCYL